MHPHSAGNARSPCKSRGQQGSPAKQFRCLLILGMYLLCHIASVVGTKGCLSEDLSSSWSHTPCRAHSSLQCATECLEVSHHFIFGDFLMCLFLFFSKQQQRHCCIWQKNKALLFKACALQYQLGQTHHCTLRRPSQKPAGQRVKRLKITN